MGTAGSFGCSSSNTQALSSAQVASLRCSPSGKRRPRALIKGLRIGFASASILDIHPPLHEAQTALTVWLYGGALKLLSRVSIPSSSCSIRCGKDWCIANSRRSQSGQRCSLVSGVPPQKMQPVVAMYVLYGDGMLASLVAGACFPLVFGHLRERRRSVSFQDVVSLMFCCLLLVFSCVEAANFGLNASSRQPPTWKRLDSGALAPSTPRRSPVTAIGSQFVGLNVNPGRSMSTLIERISVGTLSQFALEVVSRGWLELDLHRCPIAGGRN